MKIKNTFGHEGALWLTNLQELLESVLHKWQMTMIGPVKNLSYNYVAKVADSNGKPYILKIGVLRNEFENELQTLQAYAGKGCAALIKQDAANRAMLLEHVIPGKMLSEIEDETVVMEHYLNVWKEIRRPLEENGTPAIADWFQGLKKYRHNFPNGDGPISNKSIDLAEECFDYVMDTSIGDELLHGDLHHENILFSKEKGWLAIDPKGIIGDRYFDLVSFLINQLHSKAYPKERLKLRVDTICEQLKLDRNRLLKAAIAIGTLSACWSIEGNDSNWENTYRCVGWFADFLQE
ncbi:aminoglycoside phosphotransferase family protein [Oceanobacillus massiliensis]|uniref:aminoglycoside phosphotransferase family protein n=1 Tax=Oceanobacillus massiliensis TaxID=1465765 RepID=UPI0030170008